LIFVVFSPNFDSSNRLRSSSSFSLKVNQLLCHFKEVRNDPNASSTALICGKKGTKTIGRSESGPKKKQGKKPIAEQMVKVKAKIRGTRLQAVSHANSACTRKDSDNVKI